MSVVRWTGGGFIDNRPDAAPATTPVITPAPYWRAPAATPAATAPTHAGSAAARTATAGGPACQPASTWFQTTCGRRSCRPSPPPPSLRQLRGLRRSDRRRPRPSPLPQSTAPSTCASSSRCGGVRTAAGRPEPLRRRLLPLLCAVERDQVPRAAHVIESGCYHGVGSWILRQALGTAANMTFLSPLRPRTYVDSPRAPATTLATTSATSATLRGSSNCHRTCAATP